MLKGPDVMVYVSVVPASMVVCLNLAMHILCTSLLCSRPGLEGGLRPSQDQDWEGARGQRPSQDRDKKNVSSIQDHDCHFVKLLS